MTLIYRVVVFLPLLLFFLISISKILNIYNDQRDLFDIVDILVNVGLIFVGLKALGSINEAKQANEIAKEDRRPWLSIDAKIVSGGIKVDDEAKKMSCRFDILLHNSGRTTARNCHVVKINGFRYNDEVGTICDANFPDPNIFSIDVPPNATISLHHIFSKVPGAGRFNPTVFIAVKYQGPDDKFYKSTRQFEMFKNNENGSRPQFDKPENVDATCLYLKTVNSCIT